MEARGLSDPAPEVRAQLVEAVLDHFDRCARDLPWRSTRDPWAVLVSETMLQQTQVERVRPKYFAFLERFPTARSCADAPVGDVLRLWDGLGYNRRAVQLHACAVRVRDAHDGDVPDDLEALRALPGVGPYTARAVLAFAFERDVAVVDTNVARFLARAVVGAPMSSRDVQDRANELVPDGDGWRWNQAVLDFAAEVCRKRAPCCATCPIVARCTWRSSGEGPDPCEGSAHVGSRQSRFEGSDRQGRGRLVAALRRGPVRSDMVAAITGWDDRRRNERMVAGLRRDGLVVEIDGTIDLPGAEPGATDR